MKIAETVAEVRQQVKAWRKEGLTVGLVPTMGYLHEGHQSLIAKACEQNDRVVVSVFVNPTQFGPNEDLESYPRDLEHDAALCESTGAALIFHPTPAEMYPKGFCSFVDMDVLTKGLCGLSRPVHFRGVCTVVSKLLHIVQPDRAYFGEKDFQQIAVIRAMVKQLNIPVTINACPIVREGDGLALSSRNTRLTPEQRQKAPLIARTLKESTTFVPGKSVQEVIDYVVNTINSDPVMEVEYYEIVDGNTLESIKNWSDTDYPVGCITVYCGEVRLIDNIKY